MQLNVVAKIVTNSVLLCFAFSLASAVMSARHFTSSLKGTRGVRFQTGFFGDIGK